MIDDEIVEMTNKIRLFIREIRYGTDTLGYHNRDDTELLDTLKKIHVRAIEGYQILLSYEERNSKIGKTKVIIENLIEFKSSADQIANKNIPTIKEAVKTYLEFFKDTDISKLTDSNQTFYKAGVESLQKFIDTENPFDLEEKIDVFMQATKLNDAVESSLKMASDAYEIFRIKCNISDAAYGIYHGVNGLAKYIESPEFPKFLSDEGKKIKRLQKIIDEKNKEIEKLKQDLADKDKRITTLNSEKMALKTDNINKKREAGETQKALEQLTKENNRLKSQASDAPKLRKTLEQIDNYTIYEFDKIPKNEIEELYQARLKKEREEKERAEKEKAEREQAEKEKAEKEQAEKEKTEKEQAEKEQSEKEETNEKPTEKVEETQAKETSEENPN